MAPMSLGIRSVGVRATPSVPRPPALLTAATRGTDVDPAMPPRAIGCRIPSRSQTGVWITSVLLGRSPLLDDLLLERLDERDDLPLLGVWHLELRQGRARVPEENAPVALADAHAPMAELHAAAAVVHGSAGARAEEVDE